MEKSFFETFPGLKVKADMEALLTEATVSRLLVNPENKKMTVYLHSNRLIDKKDIHELERRLHCSCFEISQLHA